MAKIKAVKGREILDSRGNPTIEVDVILGSGVIGRASVPSGASTGTREAVELRDGDKGRFLGKGVQKAVSNVNKVLGPKVVGMDPEDQKKVDALMVKLDGTENKSKLGANAILGISLAVAHAAATESRQPLYRYLGGAKAVTLPVPMMNILNGGAHADNNLDFQEFMVVPMGRSFMESLRHGTEVFHALKANLKKKGLSTSVGDEGGFAPKLGSHEQALGLIVEAGESAGLRPGKDFYLAMDPAASEFFDGDKYVFKKGSMEQFSPDEMVDLYADMCKSFPIASIEDAMAEQDYVGWKGITARLGKRIQLVGDDLFVTNRKILAEGVKLGVANAVLIKVNQIGTLTETLETMAFASESKYNCVVSHRSGETEDTSISDISVATNAGQIKTGAPSRGERTAKYNRLLRIEEELGQRAKFPGIEALKPRPH
jgi:enolase